uniref:Hydrolase, alpha/beta fold family n=1 Tax=uncultured Armatimonadetes bacterium TaxID=157466 RepID=A0A6J4IRP4_9BACT|nr:Hydrolase, alpha/beta fold family [uncultured Armatimonadetes bacterium]
MTTDWYEGDVDVNGLRLHYTRTGNGDAGAAAKPSLVLAHGFSDDGRCWAPVARALAPDYDVVMVDARGHGKSDAPETGYGLADLAADLHGVITGLGLHRPAILGHSMGGATTLVLAGTYPEVPGAILIEDAGAPNLGAGASTPETDARWARMRAWVTALKGKTRDELIESQRAETPHWTEDELGPWADAKLRLSPNVLNRRDAAPVDWPALLPHITCPGLLITAEPARGAMVTEEGARELQAMIPQLRVAHIPEAGHSIRRDRFDRYLRVVRDFLEQAREPPRSAR